MSERGDGVGVIGAGWVGLVTAACFAEFLLSLDSCDMLGD
jgi:UDP-glucose 6-dehydrogenase